MWLGKYLAGLNGAAAYTPVDAIGGREEGSGGQGAEGRGQGAVGIEQVEEGRGSFVDFRCGVVEGTCGGRSSKPGTSSLSLP